MKRLGFVLLLAGLAAGGWFAFGKGRWPVQDAPSSTATTMQKGTTSAPDGVEQKTPSAQAAAPAEASDGGIFDKTLGLALQGVSLFQGSKGSELWRLKATWAHLSQTGDVINVDMPVVRYLLGEPGSSDYLDVVSQKGRVTDNQRYLTLWGDVRLTRFDEVVAAPTLNYDAATRVMVFPEGAQLEGPTTSGTATVLTWELATNTLVGEQGVLVVLKRRVAEDGQGVDGASPGAAEATEGNGTTVVPQTVPAGLPVPAVAPANTAAPKMSQTEPSATKKAPAKTARKTTQKTTNRKAASQGKQGTARR